jgi:hypothetical protein
VLALVPGRQARAQELDQDVATLEGDDIVAIVDDERGVVGPQLGEGVPLLVVEQDAVPADEVVDRPQREQPVERTQVSTRALDSRKLATNVRKRATNSGAW